MKNLKKTAVYILVVSVAVLTFIAVLSIWDVFSKEVLWKSISTIGIVAFGALIVIIASQVVDHKDPSAPTQM
jgi:hypothetical protein